MTIDCMKERMITVQLRSTIFLQQNIGYTPENAEKFRNLLIPGCKIYGIVQPGIPMLGVNPTVPQYGMSWRLFKKCDDGGEYNIAFQPGKIDIVFAHETPYGDDIEKNFCDQSIEWFTKILDTQGNEPVLRIAYAPLYAIMKDAEFTGDAIWSSILKKTAFNGVQFQDINLTFLLKRQINFNGTDIQMNLLHTIFDGVQTKTENDSQIIHNVFLFQFDLNSIPEKILNMDKEGIAAFFNGILEIKNNLVDNVIA